jgi:hypothetical protein
MVFRPVVKPLGITMKKESGKVVETSEEGDVVNPPCQTILKKRVIAPRDGNEPQERGPKNQIL